MKRSHVRIAGDAVARACSEAAAKARQSERRWWRQEMARLISEAEDMHGPGAVISASSLLSVSTKRGGE